MAELRFSYGVMSAGKSTLALQVEHTWTEAGRCGVLLTSHDRDCAGRLFRGGARLGEMADVLVPLPLPVLCWCGRPARINARLVDGVVVHEGEQVVLGDTARGDGALFGPAVRS